MTPQEEALLNRARLKIEEQAEVLAKLSAPAYHVGVVVEMFEKRVVVNTAGQLFELDRPTEDGMKNLAIGQPVDLHPKTGQIIRTSNFVSYGATGKITATEGDLFQINLPSGLITTKHTMVPGLQVGDKIVMDSTNNVILVKLAEKTQYAFKTQAVLSWDDIGACEDAKKEMVDALETPYTWTTLFEYFKKKQVKGALLWGRAGNGKTLIGRAAAGALARMHNKESVESGFIYIKGPEILDKFVGETESQIREAFAFGKAHFKKYGYPCIIFIDEADAILMRRGMRTASGMEMTIVPQFLSEMDGIEDSGVFVLLATNRADTLDPAVIRPGRIDRKIYVAPPTKENAPSVWNIHMRNIPMSKGIKATDLIQTTNEALFSEQYPLYYIDSPKGRATFSLGNLASGALIAGIVERAQAIAIRRNVVSLTGTETPDFAAIVAASKQVEKFDGLRQEDFNNALTAIHKEQYGMNHFDELREFMDAKKIDQTTITSIEQCHDGQKITPQTKHPSSISGIAIPIPNKKGGGYDA